MTSKEKFKNVSTKISAESKRQLSRILKRQNMNEYEFLQLMVEVVIRMNDDRHQLSEQMGRLIQILRMVPGFKDAATLVDHTGEYDVLSTVYFVTQKGRKGSVPVMVQRGWFDGKWSETRNVQTILEYVVERCAPDSYLRLRKCAQRYDCKSIFELLLKMVEDANLVHLDEEIGNLFNDNDRTDFGQAIEYGSRTRQKKRRTVDDMEKRQQRIRFDDADREQCDAESGACTADGTADEAGGGLGFRPFTEEW